MVSDVEAGFHEEHLELTTAEVDFFRRERDEFDGDGAGGSEEDE